MLNYLQRLILIHVLTWSRSTDSFSIFSRPVETSTSPYCDSNHSRTITFCQVLSCLFFHFLYAEVFPLSCSKTAAHNWQGFVSNAHRFVPHILSKPHCHTASPRLPPVFRPLFPRMLTMSSFLPSKYRFPATSIWPRSFRLNGHKTPST